MIEGLKCTSKPSVEPVSTAEAKLFLRIDHADEDDLIDGLIAAARIFVEGRMRRALITQTWRLKLDDFPAAGQPIELPLPPLQSVTSVKYYDTEGNQQTLSADDYVVEADAEPGRIGLATSKSWPSVHDEIGAVEVIFITGYGDAATDLPDTAISATKMMVAHLYENREAVGQRAEEVPLGVEALLDIDRNVRYR